jgi:hypothetical protein
MAASLCGNGLILWDVTVNIAYVHPVNFLAPGLRDMFDANMKDQMATREGGVNRSR